MPKQPMHRSNPGLRKRNDALHLHYEAIKEVPHGSSFRIHLQMDAELTWRIDDVSLMLLVNS